MVWEGKEAASMEKAQAAIYCRLSQDDGSLGESGSNPDPKGDPHPVLPGAPHGDCGLLLRRRLERDQF